MEVSYQMYEPDGTELQTELAYAAGFFDGEGNVRLRKMGAQLCVTQCHREPLDRMQLALGVGQVHGPYGPYKNSVQPRWEYRVSNILDIQVVYAKLRPYLGSVKRMQFESVVHANIVPRKRKNVRRDK